MKNNYIRIELYIALFFNVLFFFERRGQGLKSVFSHVLLGPHPIRRPPFPKPFPSVRAPPLFNFLPGPLLSSV